MSPFLQLDTRLDTRIRTDIVKVPRQNLRLDSKLNPRRNYGNLGRLGASLDICSQTTPLTVIEIPGEPGFYLVRDGFRRVASVDQGYAPRYQSIGLWHCIILRAPDGGIPSERDIRRWCAASNMARKNWLPIEKATFYQQEIDEAIADRLGELNHYLDPEHHITALSPSEEKQIRKATRSTLATLEGKRCDQTIQNHLYLLELPHCVQEQLYKGNISQHAALEFRKLSEEEASLVLSDVAKQDQLDLTGSQIPGDMLAPTEIDVVEDVFVDDDSPWFVPARLKKPVGEASGPRTRTQTQTIRATAVVAIKLKRKFEGKKSNKTWMRGVGEIQREIDRLNSQEYLSEADKIKLKTLRWILRENQRLPNL